MALRARQHPTVLLQTGDRVFLELPMELCAALSDNRGVSSPVYLGAE